jgi:NAD+ synthase (glutamine-hydrolysing)
MKIAVVQLNPMIGHLRSNVEKIRRFILKAREDGADLIIFPELAITGYPPRDLLFYNAFLDRVEKAIAEDIMPLAEGIAVLIGVPWREKEGNRCNLYNAALVLKDKKIISCHYKTLLSYDDVFDEHRYFISAAKTNLLTLGGMKIAVTIGEDIQLEEPFQHNPELLINLAASPYHLGKAGERAETLRSLAAKYQVPLLYVNQVGGNDELIFDGSSIACSESAKVFYQAEPFRETLFYCQTESFEIAPVQVEDDLPCLETKNYLQEEDVNWVYAALQRGLADYLKKTGFEKVIIGMSGGIDSAVIAALAVAVLGPDKVLSVMMPSRYSTEHSITDSEKLAANLQMENRLIPIEGPFKHFIESLNREGKPAIDLAEENLQARIRGDILMFISNRESGMVLTTGNKSELAVGYCTLYGDMCGGLAVLADIPKQMVYRLAVYINTLAGKELIPNSIITKPPSAELRPDQFDHDSLPPYEILDRLVHYYIEENKHIDEIVAMGYERELVENIVAKIDRSEYKRYQAAPVLRITTKAFGSGRRIPLAKGNFC